MADDLGSSHIRTDFGELSDAELVRATREGSRRAYAALWKRHSVSALKYAKTLTMSDADDVVSEAFLKVYAAIKAGRGPEEDFRYYIRSAVRNTYISMVRARRTAPAGDAIEDVIGDRGAEVATVRSFDGSATARAFLSLPTRWQEVLWHTEVEGLSREHTATLLGMKANAVSALSFRAREALRTAWLQEHISSHSDLDRGCEITTPLLGAYSRQGLSRRDRLRVEHHLGSCTHCTSVVSELSELLTPGRLALVLLPVILTGGGFAAFASKFSGGSAVVASTIAPPTATVFATVGGSSAATGAAALSVVGKVAACAIVATMIVPPTQMLIDAAQHAPSAQHSVAHSTTHDDFGALLQLDTVLVGDEVALSDQVSATSEASTHDTDSGTSSVASEPSHAGGGDSGGNGNSGGNGSAGGNANSGGNGNSEGNANAGGSPNAGVNAGAKADATEKSTEKSNSSANAADKSKATENTTEKSASGPNANANANADVNATDKSKANENATDKSKATENTTESNAHANANANANSSEKSTSSATEKSNPGPNANANANANAAAAPQPSAVVMGTDDSAGAIPTGD